MNPTFHLVRRLINELPKQTRKVYNVKMGKSNPYQGCILIVTVDDGVDRNALNRQLMYKWSSEYPIHDWQNVFFMIEIDVSEI
jgi:hypothetical protein